MSSTVTPETRTGPPQPLVDLDALIKEARDRQRRRHRRGAAAVVLLALAASVVVTVFHAHANRLANVVRVPGGPVVNVAGFAGHGRLAFISGRTVWVLDGDKRSLHKIGVQPGLYPSEPLFSSDGRWLAFVQTTTKPWDAPGAGAQVGQLWVAHGDGSEAHPVGGLAHVLLIGWSATTNVLAVAAGPISRRVPFGSLTTVRLVTPDGRSRVRVRARGFWSAAWSPTGDQLAVITEGRPLHLTLATYPLAHSGRTIWCRFQPHTQLNGMSQVVADVAGWWRGIGIGIWVYGNGMTHNNDETPLDVITRPGAKPLYLASTLSDGTTRVIAPGGSRIAVVADVSHGVNGGRVVWDKKQLQTCTVHSCTPVSTGRGDVTLDPAWSPNGRLLAYIQAPDRTTGGWTQHVVGRWYAAHRLRLLDIRTGATWAITAAHGATVPIWSSDGTSLLFVDENGIALLPRLNGKRVPIARPLFKGAWPNYYGQMAWPSQLAWWSR